MRTLSVALLLAPVALAQPVERVERPAAEPGATLVFETYNAGLAYGFVDYGEARRGPIFDALQTTEADVVCLQEVWEPEDRDEIEALLGSTFPHRVVPPVEQLLAQSAPACGLGDLFGEDKFVSCMTGECGDFEGDAQTNCIIDNCGPALTALKTENRECATALMAQVGKSAPAALWTVVRPFWHAGVFAYGGSNGLLMLSKQPLSDTGVLDFTDISTLNRRQALYGTVELEGEPVKVYCTHLTADLTRIAPYPGPFPSWAEENRAQVDRLLADAASHEGPAVLLGDFNCGRPDPEHGMVGELVESCEAIVGAGWADPAADADDVECTWCVDNHLNIEGGEHDEVVIDHVFLRGLSVASEGVRYRDAVQIEVDGAAHTTSLSDHYGYAATVHLPVPEPEPEEDEGGEEEGTRAPGEAVGRPERTKRRPR